MGKPTYNELERRLCALLKEIDHLKAHHQSARSKLQYLEDTLNNTNTPTFLKRSDFTYIFINREFERLGKIDAENVQGKDDFMIFPQAVAELFRAQDEEVVKSKKVMEFEETIPLQDGMHSFITAKFPLFDDEGNVDAVGGVCTDITARKKAESRLREAEEKYRSIVEHSPLGILLIDQNGIITTCNKKLAEILQTEVEKIIGLDLIHSLNDARVRSATSLALSGRLVQYEGWYQSFTSGKSAYLHGVFSPIYSTDQSVTSAIGIIDDSTARKLRKMLCSKHTASWKEE